MSRAARPEWISHHVRDGHRRHHRTRDDAANAPRRATGSRGHLGRRPGARGAKPPQFCQFAAASAETQARQRAARGRGGRRGSGVGRDPTAGQPGERLPRVRSAATATPQRNRSQPPGFGGRRAAPTGSECQGRRTRSRAVRPHRTRGRGGGTHAPGAAQPDAQRDRGGPGEATRRASDSSRRRERRRRYRSRRQRPRFPGGGSDLRCLLHHEGTRDWVGLGDRPSHRDGPRRVAGGQLRAGSDAVHRDSAAAHRRAGLAETCERGICRRCTAYNPAASKSSGNGSCPCAQQLRHLRVGCIVCANGACEQPGSGARSALFSEIPRGARDMHSSVQVACFSPPPCFPQRPASPALEDPVSKARILVVDDEANARNALAEILREEDYQVETAADGFKALARAESFCPDLVLSDLKMPGMDGVELLAKLKSSPDLDVEVVVMTAFGAVETAVAAMRAGAADYLTKPLNTDELLVVLDRALERCKLRQEATQLREQLKNRYSFSNIIGAAPEMQQLFKSISQIAPSRATVLLS